MVKAVLEVLKNSDLFLQKIDCMDENSKIDSAAVCWNPCLKWTFTDSIDIADTFIRRIFQWLKVQKEKFAYIRPENQNKSSRTLLSELFGTSQFSTLKMEEIRDRNIFQRMEEHMWKV